jgi:UDP-glucuronate 4-epimerase
MQKGDVTRTFADTQQLQTQFGYKHQTPLLQGIDKLYNWHSGYNGAT